MADEERKGRKSGMRAFFGYRRIRRSPHFKEIQAMLSSGVSPIEVARVIQADWREMVDVSRETLVRQLYRYKEDIPPVDAVAGEVLPSSHPSKKAVDDVIEKAKELSEGLDELAELEKLYKLQMDRIGIEHKSEKGVGKLFPGMTGEVREARELLTRILTLKMELGMLERAPDRLKIEAGGSIGIDLTTKLERSAIAKTLADPRTRERIIDALGALRREAKALPAVIDVEPEEEVESG